MCWRMTRAVLDTNIIISSVFWEGNPYKVVKKGIEGEYQIVISSEILDEVAERLRNKFHFPEEAIQGLIDVLLTFFHMVEPTSEIDIVRDKKDNKIIECAFDGKANYIVTEDPDLLDLKEFEGMKIRTAKEFLEEIG